MSIIQKIREKYAAWGIAFIAVSLIAFILMDALGSHGKGSLFGGNTTTLGYVNGQKIDYVDFESQVKKVEQNYQQQGMTINDDQRHQIYDMLWNQLVDGKVLTDQVDKLGLSVTGKELADLLYGQNPPPMLKQQFTDPKTGQYNSAQAAETIRQLKRKPVSDQQRIAFENYIDEVVVKGELRAKYAALLVGTAYYPKWLADKDNADNSSMARISFTGIPYASIADSTVKVTDGEISDYINAHKAQFKTEPSRSLNYVSFDATPSAQDSSVVLQQIESLRSGLATTSDPAGYLSQNGSSIAYYDGFAPKAKIQVPNADSITSLPVGGLFGPYLDGNTLVIAKMIDKKNLPDTIKLRQIIISTQSAPDSVAKSRIDSVQTALNGGADFAALAAKVSEAQGAQDNGGELELPLTQIAKGQGFPKELADFLLNSSKGEKKVIKIDGGYDYVEILDLKNIAPAVKVAYMAKEITASDETISAANSNATQFAGESQNLKSFEENARKKNIFARVAEVRQTDYQIMGIGSARRLVKWAFENKVGSVSEPESYGDKYVVAVITSEQDKGLPEGAYARTLVENTIRQQKKAKEIKEKIGAATDLNVVASKFNMVVLQADSISFASSIIPNLGSEPKVIGAAFNKTNLNKVSAPIVGNSAVFVIKAENVFSIPNQNNDYQNLRQNMEGLQRNNMGYKALESLRKTADVIDDRIKFY